MSIWDDTRADWDATPTSGMAFVPAARRDEFFNHYDGANPLGLADQPHSACLAKVKADQRFHMGPSRGWSDIGYNGLICQHGRAIEGRGLDYAGAHCPDHNTRGYGIQFQVGGNEAPTQAAKDRMRRLYDDLCDRSGRKLAMKGHRDGLATLCPGDIVYSWVKAGMPVSGAAATTPAKPTSKPKPTTTSKAPAFPLPRGSYFGPKSGPAASVSGYYSHRADLKRWQEQMKKRGWSLDADGLYGPTTAKVARQFQKERGLPVDSLIGAATWRAAFESPIT